MKSNITTHWLAKFFGSESTTLNLVDGQVVTDSSVSIELSKLNELPTLKGGLLFGSLHFGDHVFRGLPKKKATLFLNNCHKFWYMTKFVEVSKFHKKAEYHLTKIYLSSSKYKRLQQFAANVKTTYQTSPKSNLLPSNVELSFKFVDQIISDNGSLLDSKRNKFIATEAQRYTKLFDTIESNPLTDRQREACVKDDDNNLVLAGAGTGKTSTMIGKAGYLVQSGKAKPDEILMLAFGNKAAKELQERINEKLGSCEIKASTFHKIGKFILSEVEGKPPSVSDLATDAKMREKYIDNVLDQLLTQPKYERKAVKYFEKYLYPDTNPFDFKTKGEYLKYLEENDIRSLKGDLVKSYGELLIANYLFVNGIDYKYEEKYKISTQTSQFQQYKPDFYLVEDEIYIEHYGIDRDQNTAPYINAIQYNNDIEWKRKTHIKNETICLETFHYQKTEGNLLEALEKQLCENGIEIEPIGDKSILDTLKEFGQVSILSSLLSSLLVNVKNSCHTIEQAIDVARRSNNSAQAMAALDLLIPILEDYENTLSSNNDIDFNDMIYNATKYINDGKFIPKWKYILIDEFQDIASSRAILVKALRDNTKGCSLFCVGDDWQSIYRFTGSDLNYTTQFKEEFGHHSLTKLDMTFRFNNSICDIAAKFVTKNPIQEKKILKTNDQVDLPAVSVLRAKDSYDLKHVEKALDKINSIASKPSSVYVICRYNFLVNRSELSSLSRKFTNLTINQISMHGSKGKEADFVIIVGLEKGKYGFPSEKITHPLLELYLPEEEPFLHAEERRLLYVAITRAKKRAYLVADMSRPSSFMKELLMKGEYKLCLNEFETPIEQIEYAAINCPECMSGTLTVRRNDNAKKKFAGCSNYKRCTYTESCCPKCDNIMSRQGRFRTCISCNWKIPMCSKCSGEMRRRPSTGHWGCSNFRGKENYPTCTFQENSIQF